MYRKSNLCFPRNETEWPRSQFLHSCICERFIYSQDRSAYIFGCSKIADTWMWNWKAEHYNSVLEITRPRSFIYGNTWIGTRHLFWILIGALFAVQINKLIILIKVVKSQTTTVVPCSILDYNLLIFRLREPSTRLGTVSKWSSNGRYLCVCDSPFNYNNNFLVKSSALVCNTLAKLKP